MAKTNLELIKETDQFPYEDEEPEAFRQMQSQIWTMIWQDEQGTFPIGYMLDRVVQELLRAPHDLARDLLVDHEKRTVQLLHSRKTEAERTLAMSALTGYWREHQKFDILRTWRNELWPVYGRGGDLLFSIERGAMGLFGTMRYGVHLSAFVRDTSAAHGLKMWVPTRAANKSTFPGMLDNTVAGGLMTGEDPFECVIREADEEASLPDALVRGQARSVGTATYICITDKAQYGEDGLIYPECEWIYDLELPADVIPQPKDGEVAEFRLQTVDEVQCEMAAGRFKTNCSLVMIDFFDRHGILTDEIEPRLPEIRRRMHRELPFPGPHQKEWVQQR